MLKRLMEERYTNMIKTKLAEGLRGRWEQLEVEKHDQLKEIHECELDPMQVAELLATGKASTEDRKKLFSLGWGTFPTGVWLERHGWAIDATCPACGAADDAAHAILGCPAAVPDELLQERRNAWRRALGQPFRHTAHRDGDDKGPWRR